MNTVLVLSHPNIAQILTPQSPLPETEYTQTAHTRRYRVQADYQPSFALKEYCFQAAIDWAVLPDIALNDIGLIVSDMDSTLITIECIDEIADRLGIKARIAAITERAMQGQMDFADSLRARVALLKGLPESELAAVYHEKVRLSAGVQALVATCKAHQIQFMLVSGGFTFFTERLQQELGLDFAYANTLGVDKGILDGTLNGKIVDAQAKADLLNKYRTKLTADKNTVVAVGDGANDIPMLQAADIGFAFHAKPAAQNAADCLIRFGGLDVIAHCFR